VEENAPQSEASSPEKGMRTDRDVKMEVQESYEQGERGAPQLRKEVADGQNAKSSPKRFALEYMPTELFDVRHVYSACNT